MTLTLKLMLYMKVEKLRMQRESADRLEQQSLHYEDRITELQSVIAELRKKIDLRHVNMILYVLICLTSLSCTVHHHTVGATEQNVSCQGIIRGPKGD